MKVLERAFGSFSIERPRRHFMGAEIVKQRAGDRRLANAPFVSTDKYYCRLAHAASPCIAVDTQSMWRIRARVQARIWQHEDDY